MKVESTAMYPQFRLSLIGLIKDLDSVYKDTSMSEETKGSKFYEILTTAGYM